MSEIQNNRGEMVHIYRRGGVEQKGTKLEGGSGSPGRILDTTPTVTATV